MSELTLKENLTKLAQTRNASIELQAMINVVKKELAQLPLMQMIDDLSERLEKNKKEQEELSDEIRSDAYDLASAYDFIDREPVPGVNIKQFTVVTITDEAEAKKWASLNAPSMLSLSKKFNSMVAELEVPFKEVTQEYRVQIASKLDEYLETNE